MAMSIPTGSEWLYTENVDEPEIGEKVIIDNLNRYHHGRIGIVLRKEISPLTSKKKFLVEIQECHNWYSCDELRKIFKPRTSNYNQPPTQYFSSPTWIGEIKLAYDNATVAETSGTIKPVKKAMGKITGNIIEKIKDLVLDENTRILREEGFEDKCGMTQEAKDLMLEELLEKEWANRRAEIAENLRKLRDEEKKK